MLCLRANLILLLAFFGLFSSPAYAQFNLKTGYNVSFLSVPGLNHLISSFNQTKTYTSSLSDLKWLQGFEGGIRWRGGIHAIEMGYQGGYNILKATGQDTGAVSTYTDKLKFFVQSATVGYQIGDGFFSLGTDLQYQWYTAKYLPGQTQQKLKNIQNMWAFKFYMLFTLTGGEGINMALEPYMVLPTQYYDLQPLAHILGIEEPLAQEKWIRYGITLLFYNGPRE